MAVFVLLLYGIVISLAELQITKHDDYVNTSMRKAMRTYSQKASRGNILDRNGTAMVSNALGFQVSFDHFTWDKTQQNEVILQLCALMDSLGEEYMNTLPIAYQSEMFLYTSVSETDRNYKNLLKFFNSYKKEFQADMSAPAAIAAFAKRYKVADTYTPQEQLKIISIRYDMEQQGFSAATPYIFAPKISLETMSKVSEASIFFPGVIIGTTETREYKTPAAAHILGRVGVIYAEEKEEYKAKGYALNAIVGKDGAEKAFEEYLRPVDGLVGLESNIDGDFSEYTTLKEPQPGKDVYLTIDLGMQAVAEQALADTIAQIKANSKYARGGLGWDVAGGSAVVIDVNSGEILACASNPTYNLGTFNADYKALSEDPLTPMLNRPLMGAYPPGSIFKMVTALAALEEGIVTPQKIIRDLGVYEYYAPSYTPACWLWNQSRRTHGNTNVSDAIKYSCNYFFFDVSREMGIDTLNKYAKMLGLGEPTGVEISGERSGNLAGPESRKAKGGPQWEPGETIQAAIGQSEQQFTPIQLANYMATLVNGGNHYKPHFLKQVATYDGSEVVYETPKELEDVINIAPASLEAIKKGMLGATTDDGTASSVFRNYPIQIGGKTGSVEISKTATAHGSFLSFAPYDKPEIAVCVLIEHAGTGGAVAPVVKAIYDYYFQVNQPEEAPTP